MKPIIGNITINKIFNILCFAYFILYTVFCLSPSSYGLALNMFGIEHNHLFGKARPIRSDEWAVWTPYTQMAVNNHFERFFIFPEYQIDLRNFNQLPLWDWALPFKPLTWGYFVFAPATGFSIFYAGMTLLFITGWKLLTEKLLGNIEHASLLAILFSLLMYFTGSTQYWWTTVGPILAFSPWLILSLLSQNRFRYFFVFYASIAWLLSHTYPPIIIPTALIAVACIIYLTSAYNKAWYVDMLLKATAAATALALAIWYYTDVITVMMQTVYPGNRFSAGGSSPWLLWFTSFFPFAIQSKLEPLAISNICEIATSGSYLLLMVCCFTRLDISRLKNISAFVVLAAFFNIWMLVEFPAWFAKITLFSKVPDNRIVFSLGLLMNLAALLYMAKSDIIINRKRLFVFFVIVLSVYSTTALSGITGWFEKSAWELLLIPLILGIFLLKKYEKPLFLCAALVVNILYTFTFNPLSSATSIFTAQQHPAFQSALKNFPVNADGWVITSHPGAILTGLGVKSLQTVLMQPQIGFYRSLYPNMEEKQFNQIFNRYAHLLVNYQIIEPNSPQPDVIQLPLKDVCLECYQSMIIVPKTKLPEAIKLSDIKLGGSIDVVKKDKNQVMITGWKLSEKDDLFILNYPSKTPDITIIARPDVVTALQDKELNNSGFIITLNEQEAHNVCIVSHSEKYGYRKLPDHSNFKNCAADDK